MRFGFSTAGESHGPGEVTLVNGVPAGLGLVSGDVNGDLARRQRGYGRGGRQKIEKDEIEFLGGVPRGMKEEYAVAMIVRYNGFGASAYL